jgi:hypothetical protein
MILICMASLRAEGSGNEPSTTWGPEAAGCRLSATADRASYRFDQPIRLHLKLENVGDKTVHLIGSPHSVLMTVGFRLDVHLPDGEPAPLTLEGQRQTEVAGEVSVSGFALEAGHSATHIVPMLNHLYDMTLLKEYSVTVYWHLAPQQGEEKPIEVKSNVLKILVHDEGVDKERGQEDDAD